MRELENNGYLRNAASCKVPQGKRSTQESYIRFGGFGGFGDFGNRLRSLVNKILSEFANLHLGMDTRWRNRLKVETRAKKAYYPIFGMTIHSLEN